jgi:hypothetical protein
VLPTLLVSLLALPASAQTFRDWQAAQCEVGCVATVSIGLAGPGSGLATLATFPRKDGAGVTVRVQQGVDLAAGIGYSHPARDEAVGPCQKDLS